MTFFNFLKDYPQIGTACIAIVSGALGWIFRNIVQFFIEKSKYTKELKTFFWKEKVNSAKKASEYYLEHMNFINLVVHKFEMFEQGGGLEYQELYDSYQKEIDFYSNKLKAFPHFEHHHINIFYDFDEERSMEINKRNFEINRELVDLFSQDGVVPDSEIQNKFSELKGNYQELYKIYKKYLEVVRKDLKGFL